MHRGNSGVYNIKVKGVLMGDLVGEPGLGGVGGGGSYWCNAERCIGGLCLLRNRICPKGSGGPLVMCSKGGV